MQAEAFKVKLVLKGAPSNAASGLGYRWLKSSPHGSGQVKALPMNKRHSKERHDASRGGQHVTRQTAIHHNEGDLATGAAVASGRPVRPPRASRWSLAAQRMPLEGAVLVREDPPPRLAS